MITMSGPFILVKLSGKILGSQAERIVEKLIQEGEIGDEEIASDLKIDENEVRRILMTLYENSIVKYRRVKGVKDRLYKYYWRVTDEDPLSLLETRRKKAIAVLRRILEEQESKNYYCPVCGRTFTFDEAVDLLFSCPKCQAVLEMRSPEKLEKLRKAIEILEAAVFTE